jgi:hypothetical protein
MSEQAASRTTAPMFLRKVADVDPKVEVRQSVFPERRIVLAITFAEIGEITVPFFPAQAAELGQALCEFAEQLATNETGDLN